MIRVGVCDDFVELRDHICDIVNKQDDMSAICRASSGGELETIDNLGECDILLVDIQMEYETAGIDAIAKITEKYPDIKIIVLTVHDNEEFVFDAYLAGAIDYLLKDSPDETVINTIRNVYGTTDYIGNRLMRAVKSNAGSMRKKQESLMFFIHGYSTLTPAEKRILRDIYMGKSRNRIANDEYLSYNTVSVHIRHILRKLNYSNTTELRRFLKSINFYDLFE